MSAGTSPSTGLQLRILQLVVTDRFAGVERYVTDVSNELSRRGHHVTVVGGSPTEMPGKLVPAVVWQPGSSVWAALRASRTRRRPDIVHAHMTRAEYAAVLSVLGRGVPVVATRHFASPRGSGRLGHAFSRIFNSCTSGQLAISTYVADRLERAPDLVAIPGTVTSDSPYDPDSCVVVMVQRLEPEKRTSVAIRAWSLSRLAGQGWRLRIVGEGAERSALERLTHDQGVADSVEFVGWSRDVARHYAQAALLVATTPVEACGLTVLEAMAAGVPVLAAASGGHLETVGRAAQEALFPAGDAEALAESLRRLAGNRGARIAMSEQLRGYQRQHLTVSRHVDHLIKLYEPTRGCQRPVSRRRG